MSPRSTICPRCGAPMPADGSPCPRCLMELAVKGPAGPSGETTIPTPLAPDLGTIGPYRLLSVLGEGGMGTVYLAEQREPIQRRVALKLVRAGLAGKEALARFEAERQALALMTHPGIARVLDAGTAESGAPYFAMEYVHGEPINAYCDKKRLSTPERIDLFRAVCAAVQHAHQRGILHRDLKPSNILVEEVDGEPRPRVIDFGLAKALNQRLTERTLFTERGAIVGTPEYMSPEQAAGEAFDVDTTTDVYSLGVVLYELLTGSLPHDPQKLREAGWLGMMKMLREEEPKKPSTQVSTFNDETASAIAGKRKTEPRTLRRSLTGDLDWIVLKALDKERERRYPNVSDLSADLERHLASEPVAAGPASRWYRATRFARRHRAAVATASLIAILFGAALVLALREVALRAEQRQEAIDRLEAERIVADFNVALVERFAARPNGASSGWQADQAALAIGDLNIRLRPSQRSVQSSALVFAAGVLRDLELGDQSIELLRRALPFQDEHGPRGRFALAQNLYLLALLDEESTDRVEQMAKSYDLFLELVGEAHESTADAFCGLAELRSETGRAKGSFAMSAAVAQRFERDAARCVDLTSRLGPGAVRLLARRLAMFGFYFQLAGDRQDLARSYLDRAVELLRPLGDQLAWQLAETLELRVGVEGFNGDRARAIALYSEACALRELAGGRESRGVALCNLNFGGYLIETGERKRGFELRSAALDVLERVDGEDFSWRTKFPPDESNMFFQLTTRDPVREDVRRAFARAREGTG